MRSVSRLLALALMLAQFTIAAVIAERIDPGRATSAPGDSVVWYDFQLLTVEGKGWRTGESFYDRLPAKAKEIVPPSVWGLSHHSSGICARFTTDAPLVQVRWTVLNKELALPHMPATGVSGVDLYSRDAKGVWRFVQNGRPVRIQLGPARPHGDSPEGYRRSCAKIAGGFQVRFIQLFYRSVER